MQKVYDWCSMINKGTISALIKYWEDEQLTDATARAEYVKKALTGPTPPFLYRRIKYDADGLLIVSGLSFACICSLMIIRNDMVASSTLSLQRLSPRTFRSQRRL